MYRLEGPVKGGRRFIAIAQGHVQHFLPVLQIRRRPGHAPPADVLAKRDSGQVRKHPLKVVGGTARQPAKLLWVDVPIQVCFQIGQRLVPVVQPIHTIPSLSQKYTAFCRRCPLCFRAGKKR